MQQSYVSTHIHMPVRVYIDEAMCLDTLNLADTIKGKGTITNPD